MGVARPDGRQPMEVRQRLCKVGVSEAGQGSSYVETSGCRVVCTVFGPKQQPIGGEFDEECKVRVNLTIASFAEDKRRNNRLERNPTAADRHAAAAIETAFQRAILAEKYPKSLLEINFLVLETDSSMYTSCVHAASLALAQAGMEVRDMVLAASAALTSSGELILDPTSDEIDTAAATFSVTTYVHDARARTPHMLTHAHT
eukprot:Rhum_TRINITY_DN7708_c0_g2::Rhum_TRINITY_DN7708_c0_g2_i1::g.24336::m.24336/K11600/RRP41, EXOSC4, SKI6; exosome complex component RRP41